MRPRRLDAVDAAVRDSRDGVRATQVATLPAEPPTPINWSDNEVEALKWPPLQDEINARKKRVDEVASEASLPADKVERLAAIAASRACLLYTSPSPRDRQKSRMPSSA